MELFYKPAYIPSNLLPENSTKFAKFANLPWKSTEPDKFFAPLNSIDEDEKMQDSGTSQG